MKPLFPLIIDAHVADVQAALERSRAVVLSASPGAGKTTRIPPALIDRGPVILLQPRRLAARAVARRIAEERQWTVGQEIGWQIRFEKRFTHRTRLLVVTEGILTARLQQDPLLSDFATVILDEFHERSIHADVGLALARQAWLARDDLRIVVMSATLDVDGVARFLGDAPIVKVPGALHELTIEYGPGESIAAAAASMLPRTAGHVLCFLPGAREVDRARADLASLGQASGVEIVPLHGSLEGHAQDAAISPTDTRRIILATNIAETSLTVPGVSAVVDSGLVKIARYDAHRGIDSLTLERVTVDSAEQRAGRAARLGPGVARRLWDARDRLRSHREPDIDRVDLAPSVLDLLAWGADPFAFEWFEAPSSDRIDAALRLLHRLGAIDTDRRGARVTPLGRQMQRLPLHPRLARILIEGKGAPEAAAVCATLTLGATGGMGASGALGAIGAELQRIAKALGGDLATHISDDALRHAIFTGYADRLAKRRPGVADRFLLATGHGAALAREAGEVDSEYVVALDVVAAERDGISESRIRSASPVNREWIHPTSSAIEHWFDAASGRVRAARVERYDAIVLSETPISTDPLTASARLAEAWLARDPDETTVQLLRRLRFAAIDVDLAAIAGHAAASARTIEDIDLDAHLPFEVKRALVDRAPASIVVPSGRTMKLNYGEDGSVSASVKLQELFGLAESPTIGPARVPVIFHLLAPNGRPVQTTRDLRSFWERTYPEVRKELRGRYPKHPWPEDPWDAQPTHRTTRGKPGPF